jgi:hypothetical protein
VQVLALASFPSSRVETQGRTSEPCGTDTDQRPFVPSRCTCTDICAIARMRGTCKVMLAGHARSVLLARYDVMEGATGSASSRGPKRQGAIVARFG